MNGTLSYLWSILGTDFDSWNTSQKLEQLTKYLPGYDKLGAIVQKEIANHLQIDDIRGMQTVWEYRDLVLPLHLQDEDEFVSMFVFDPNTTKTLIAQYMPTDTELCRKYEQEILFIMSIIMLVPCTLLICLLMLIKPRKILCKKCCWGRPSFPVPLNFIDEHGRRWAFCGAFAIMTNFVLGFFEDKLFWQGGYWEDEQWTLRFSWARPFMVLGNVIHLGYLFYPLFACLSMRRYIAANSLGLVYLSLWLYIDINYFLDCPIEAERDTRRLSSASVVLIVTAVPTFIGYAAVATAFVIDFIINCHTWYKGRKQTTKLKGKGKKPLAILYIEHLLSANRKQRPETLAQRAKGIFIYTAIIGFKYPPRVVCTMVVAAILLMSTCINIGVQFDEVLSPLMEADALQGFIASGLPDAQIDGNKTEPWVLKALTQAPYYISGIHWCVVFSNVCATIIHVISMAHMTRTYRTHVRQFMKGDHSWHHKLDSSPAKTLFYGLRYSGYQIAYILWGYMIMFSVLSIISITITVFIIVPVTFGERPFLLNSLIMTASTIAASLLISNMQVLASKFGFLQHQGKTLALTNRNVYHGMSFFIFFFNIILGAFSVLRRSLLSLVFGTLLLCRLDRCLLMKGFEKFDAGFQAYLGMLTVDATHNHPILKGFIHILQEEINKTKENSNEKSQLLAGTRTINKRIRNQWWKLLTLINNPILVIERVQLKRLNGNQSLISKDEKITNISIFQNEIEDTEAAEKTPTTKDSDHSLIDMTITKV